jgi:16S rRNA processing protein RimM
VTRPRARLLALGTAVTVAGRTAAIVRRAGTEQRPIVRLEGVEDRAAAEALRGMELAVEGERAPALGEQEWWAQELEGCVVHDGEHVLGTVSRLIELPSCEALEVPRAGGEPVLVPMVKDAVRRVEVAERRIEVDLDFLDLAPASSPDAPAPDTRAADAPAPNTPAPDAPAPDAPAADAPAPDAPAATAPSGDAPSVDAPARSGRRGGRRKGAKGA